MKKAFWQKQFKDRAYFAYALLFLIIILITDLFFSSTSYEKLLHRRFQQRFNQLENELLLRFDNIVQNITYGSPHNLLAQKLKEFKDLADNQKIYFYIYKNDSLLIWSDNRIPEADILPDITYFQQFIQLSNGWFYAVSRNINEYKIIGLLLIKNNYLITNDYLINHFNPVFTISPNVNVKSNIFKEKYVIKNIHNFSVFSLDFPKKIEHNKLNIILILLLIILFFIFLAKGFRKLINSISKFEHKLYLLAGFSILLFVLYFFMRYFEYPTLIFNIQVFKQPILLTQNLKLVPIDIFIFSLIVYLNLFFAYNQLKDYYPLVKFNSLNVYIISISLLVVSFLCFLAIHYLFIKILYHTSLSFYIADFFSNSMTSLIIIISIVMLYLSFYLFIDYIFKNIYAQSNIKLKYTIGILIIISYLAYQFYQVQIIAIIVYLLSIGSMWFLRCYKRINLKYKHIIQFTILYSIYAAIIIFMVGKQRLMTDEKRLAVNLAQERDKIAETLMMDVQKKILLDTTIIKVLQEEHIDYPWIYKYVKKKYFSGYLDRYDVQLTICEPIDSLITRPDFKIHHCYSFFDSLIFFHTKKISDDLFFLKSSYGRISYLSRLAFKNYVNRMYHIYIQIDSKLNTDILGYPQLLLNESDVDKKLDRYSYAKYYKNKIAYQFGSFVYNTSALKYSAMHDTFKYVQFSGYDHLFYKPDDEILIILSRPSYSLLDLLISFSYLFIINFLLLNGIIFLVDTDYLRVNIFKKGFRRRIQLSIIGILFISLIVVSAITMLFIIQQYTRKYYDSYGEKLQSIYFELYNNLSDKLRLTYILHSNEYSNLESLLKHLSSLFSTDIHIYGTDGRLIATSRSEIFEKGLCGNMMNPSAYYQLINNSKIEFVQNEWIGKQKYLSVYTPLVNIYGNVIGYINLPYFAKQSKLSNEITTILLAIVNIYLIIIIVSISIAIVTANKITEPLEIIQESISQMRLGKGNVKIIYKGQDELGNLIDEYNKKVEELEHSVELLSKTERESAWREMAKQVAHEIKNPLTPMKLSIQQMQRTYLETGMIDEKVFQRVTNAVIEQIDNLSAIATAFSNIAKMPVAKKEVINIHEIITDVIDLFKDYSVKFIYTVDEANKCKSIADKEQMRRVFINLITNSIQALGNRNDATVKISIHCNSKIKILVEDNGIGVPEHLIGKLFQPNFTTKTSGSGLGLAICKSIIESIGGSIHYHPANTGGSCFIIYLPKFEKNT